MHDNSYPRVSLSALERLLRPNLQLFNPGNGPQMLSAGRSHRYTEKLDNIGAKLHIAQVICLRTTKGTRRRACIHWADVQLTGALSGFCPLAFRIAADVGRDTVVNSCQQR